MTFNGRTMSLIDWANTLGISVASLRTRRALHWSDEECLGTPVRVVNGDQHGMPKTRRESYRWVCQAERDATLKAEREGARWLNAPPPRTMWDVPVELDPWGQAAIDVAIEDGGFRLDEIGVLMGVSRERIRQIEAEAMAKVRDWCLEKGHDVAGLLGEIEALRGERETSEEDGWCL
jgi:hypothetical protein